MSVIERYKLSSEDIAGLKLLATALERNVKACRRRYYGRKFLEVCQQVAVLSEQIMELVDDGVPFSINIQRQARLPGFDDSDEAYGEID